MNKLKFWNIKMKSFPKIFPKVSPLKKFWHSSKLIYWGRWLLTLCRKILCEINLRFTQTVENHNFESQQCGICKILTKFLWNQPPLFLFSKVCTIRYHGMFSKAIKILGFLNKTALFSSHTAKCENYWRIDLTKYFGESECLIFPHWKNEKFTAMQIFFPSNQFIVK